MYFSCVGVSFLGGPSGIVGPIFWDGRRRAESAAPNARLPGNPLTKRLTCFHLLYYVGKPMPPQKKVRGYPLTG